MNGEQSLPERLLEFLAPYRPMAQNETDYRNLVMLGIAAWNLSLFDGEEFDRNFSQFAGVIPGFDDSIRDFLLGMIEHKRESYPDDRRYVVSYEMSGSGNDLGLSVSSTPLPAR